MQKITPCIWIEKDPGKVAEFYVSVFEDAKILRTVVLHNTPSDTAEIVIVKILDQNFTLLGAGPFFKPTPAISFLVACKTNEEVETLWNKLIKGGMALMELGEYPFSPQYGWVQDKYGVSWQIMHMGEREIKQKITPTLMFVGEEAGKAEEAMKFYASIFHNAEVGSDAMRYEKGEEPDQAGTIKHAEFTLENQHFAAMDSAHEHKFGFNEGISLEIHCDTQAEMDHYWEKLSAVPESEQCGWLKDKFGVSWQIAPTALDKMMQDKDREKVDRVTQAVLKMKKLNLQELQDAFEGK